MGALSRILIAAALAIAPTPVAAPSPRATIESRLLDVSCPSDSSCVAVGSSLGDDHQRRALIERWDGTRWAIARPAPTPGLRTVSLLGVSCATPRSCMAIGSAVRGKRSSASVSEHWNGSSWTALPLAPAGVRGVSCPTARACVAVGDGLIERWTGRRWARSTRLPASAQLDAVSCATATACLAVGTSISGGGFTPLGRVWDGSLWRSLRLPFADQTELATVACPSATFCLVLGTLYAGDAPTAVADRWDGSALRPIAVTPPPYAGATALNRVACASPTSCLALGGFGAGDPAQEMGLTWAGAQLSTAFTGARPGLFPWSSVACRPSFCMLVGASARRVDTARQSLEKSIGS